MHHMNQRMSQNDKQKTKQILKIIADSLEVAESRCDLCELSKSWRRRVQSNLFGYL